MVTGSIATDHLMQFPGKFVDSIVASHLDRLSLSFLVSGLATHYGGVGANVAFGMGVLGMKPVLVGAVGSDFDGYRAWLEGHGVDCAAVHVSATSLTARFTCTTDTAQCQIASFYPGAMSEASTIALAPVVSSRAIDLMLIGPDDPAAMLAHTREAKRLGVAFAADPSQQLPRLSPGDCRTLIDGAAYLFSNDYEWELLTSATRWSEREILGRVGARITTLGSKGCLIVANDGTRMEVGAVPVASIVDPTGAGDAFRAGFLAAVVYGLAIERAAQLGSLIAALTLDAPGPQEWTLDIGVALSRLKDAYGDKAAGDIEPVLRARAEETRAVTA
jgi:adenosine kinase